MVKNPPAMQETHETWVQSLGQEDPLEEEIATDSNILARSIPGSTVVKNLPANVGDARDMGSVPGSGIFSGLGNGNPVLYSCLKNPTNRGA